MARLTLALLLVALAAGAVFAKDAGYVEEGYGEGYDGGYASGPSGPPPGTFLELCDIEFNSDVDACPDKFKLDHIRSYVNEIAEELLAAVGSNVPKVKTGVLDCLAATAGQNTTLSVVLKIKAAKGDADAIEELLTLINESDNLCSDSDFNLVEECAEYDIFRITCGESLTKLPKGVVVKGTSPEYKKYVAGRYGDGAYAGSSGSYASYAKGDEPERSTAATSQKAGKGAKPGKGDYSSTNAQAKQQ